MRGAAPAGSHRATADVRLRLVTMTAFVAVIVGIVAGCGGTGGSSGAGGSAGAGGPSIVVTYPVLGAVVKELVGDRAAVTVLMPNGVDPHDWSPSARDIERVAKADLVVANGLGLEQGLTDALAEAARNGIPVFYATDHVKVRTTGVGDAAGAGAPDPHYWVDPVAMKDVVAALTAQLGSAGIDVADRAADLESRLTALDAEVRTTLDVVPEARRRLVTGHESMGYFADRYGFTIVGAVIPGLTSQGEVSAGALADLKAAIEAQGVPAVFTEVGTPAAVAEAIGRETGAAVVPLATHTLPDDGSYFTFIRGIASAIAEALR
jgi:zinc/manganese transport system substrate-binding protein